MNRISMPFGVILAWLLCGTAACANDIDEDDRGRAQADTLDASTLARSVLAQFDFDQSPIAQRKLPKRLREISGLTATSDGRLLGHHDERGIVYELDLNTAAIVKSFHLGGKGVKADFEGISTAEGLLYLVASDGTLFETREGKDGERVEYTTYAALANEDCEVEGLAFDPSDRMLLLACKKARGPGSKDSNFIYRWSLVTKRLAEPASIRVPREQIARFLPNSKFHTSGITRDPASGHYLLIASREHAILEITPSGEVINAMQLKVDRHRHAEGIAIGQAGTAKLELMISDEGDGRRGRLTRYQRSFKKPDVPR